MEKGFRVTFEPYLIDKEVQVNIFGESEEKLAFCFVPVADIDKMVGQIFDAKDRIVNRDKYEIQKLEAKLRQINLQQDELEDEAKDIKDAIADLRKSKNVSVQPTQEAVSKKRKEQSSDRKPAKKS